MFGVNATDKETIPASFMNLYKARYPNGRSIQVVNYGQCGFHFVWGELMLLSHLLYSGNKPSIVIVFDGLNDLLLVNAAQKRLPYYYYHLRATGKDDIDYDALNSVNDSHQCLGRSARFEAPGRGVPAREALAGDLLDKYLENRKNMKELATAHGITPFFFIQPTPYYHYPNRGNDPVCASERNEILERDYAILEKTVGLASGIVPFSEIYWSTGKGILLSIIIIIRLLCRWRLPGRSWMLWGKR